MVDRVFCIDFGSAFTKVALRRDPGAESTLLASRSVGVGEVDFCLPSVVAVDRRGTKAIPEFGDRAAGLTEGGGIEVYRHWKKLIFQVPGSKPQVSPLESLLQSPELQVLATKHGVAAGQLGYLQQLVAAAKSLIAGPGGRVISAEVQQRTIAASLAPHFFLWLRQQVLDACNRLPATGLKYESIPVRIAVPAFAHGKGFEANPGCKILTDALGKAGWPLHPDTPVVSEPYANAVGILTKASNVIQKGRIRLGDMFGKVPFITVMKSAADHPAYRAIVIDVGAFTTDLAAITLKPDGTSTSDPDANIDITQNSVPFGVSDLDERVIAALPKEKGEWLRKATPVEWEDFRPAVYSSGKGYRSGKVGLVGGTADGDAVSACLEDLGKRLAEEATKFVTTLPQLPKGALQELILTGGGSIIPAFRDNLLAATQASGLTFVKIHGPDMKKSMADVPIAKLDLTFARGGSALGGTSLYFEREDA
ncbi:MAG: hypothetical protein C0467_05840 [Planctomycetaceae bacterium]|nr:hypothetical protein [Planctomycetaceae bacterium]